MGSRRECRIKDCKLTLDEFIDLSSANAHSMGEANKFFRTDILDFWPGWIEVYVKAHIAEVYLVDDGRAFDLRLVDPRMISLLGYTHQFFPITLETTCYARVTEKSGLVPAHLYPTQAPRVMDFGVYTKTIIEMNATPNLRKRRSALKRYNSFPIIFLADAHPVRLLHLFDDWTKSKMDRGSGSLELYLYQNLVNHKDFRYGRVLDGIVVIDPETEDYIGLSLGYVIHDQRWGNLVRLVSDPRKYPGLTDFLYQRTAELFGEFPEESDGLAGFGDSEGCASYKKRFSSEELMRYYV